MLLTKESQGDKVLGLTQVSEDWILSQNSWGTCPLLLKLKFSSTNLFKVIRKMMGTFDVAFISY